MRLFPLLLVLPLLALPSLAQGQARIDRVQETDRLAWVVDGRVDKTRPGPLVLALHGYRKPPEVEVRWQTPEDLAWPRLAALAEAEGFVAVFPSAYRGQWNLVPGLMETTLENGQQVDDESYLLGLVAALVSEGLADPERLYLVGISDGAIMTHRLICLRDTPFAAAAALIGTAHERHIADCSPEQPPALLQVHGDNDQVLPYDGWIFRTGREVSVPEVMEHWRRLHGCRGQKGERLPDIDPDDGSSVLLLEWTGCADEPNVRLFKIKGGGHRVPALDAEQSDEPKWRVNRDLDTMVEAWRFLSAAWRPAP